MKRVLSRNVLIALSIGYGLTLALLGAFGSSAVAPVAIVGALVVGGLWVLRGVVLDD